MCEESRDALPGWLDISPTESWTFGSHAQGNVVGEVLLTNGVPQQLGFLASLFADDHELTLTAIHEGAHLAGYGEPQARWVEANCVRLD